MASAAVQRSLALSPACCERAHSCVTSIFCNILLANAVSTRRSRVDSRDTVRRTLVVAQVAGDVIGPGGPGTGTAARSDWSEVVTWEAALHAAAGSDPGARAALRRSLDSLHTLLPDLEPHWGEQLLLHRKLVGIEALLRGTAPPAIPGAGSLSAEPTRGSDPSSSRDVCLYAEAQRAAQELQGLGSFVRQYCSRATAGCFDQTQWMLSTALMGAARNYCGPGSTLLRAGDLDGAATAVRALRRSHEAHLSGLIRLQVRLATRLPEVSLRLIQLRQDTAGKDLDVGLLVATNLGLLADLT